MHKRPLKQQKRQQIGLQITATEQPQKADQRQRDGWMQWNATENFPLHTPTRSASLSNTLTQSRKDVFKMFSQEGASNTQRSMNGSAPTWCAGSFHGRVKHFSIRAEVGTGLQQARAHTWTSTRQGVKWLKFFQGSSGHLRLCFNQLLIPSTHRQTAFFVFFFNAPDELCR